MYINSVFYKKINLYDSNMSLINEHADRYFNDLYQSYQLTSEINNEKLVCDYKEIASHMFDVQYNQAVCSCSDYLFFPSWGWISDSTVTIPEFYYKNKHKWTGSLLDVRDCGSLCVYFAVHMILNLYQNQSMLINTICSIECEFPKNKYSNEIFPEINYVSLLSFSTQKNCNTGMSILFCNIYHIASLLNYTKIVFETIIDISKKYGIVENQFSVMMRHLDEKNVFPSGVNVVSHPISSGLLCYLLNQLLDSEVKMTKQYIFIIDFDLKTHSFGILLVKRED